MFHKMCLNDSIEIFQGLKDAVPVFRSITSFIFCAHPAKGFFFPKLEAKR